MKKRDRYLTAFSEDLRPICSHQFASHVLEMLLQISSKKVFDLQENSVGITNSHEDDKSAVHSTICLNFVLKISRFLLNNLEEYIMDTYANHVTRTAVSCLSGSFEELTNEKNANKQKKQYDVYLSSVTKNCPDEFKSLLLQFADLILNSPLFSEYGNNVLMSGLVQSVLLSLHIVGNKKYLKSITVKLLDTIYSPDVKGFDVLKILSNQQAVHLLNAMIVTSTDKIYEKINHRCFSGRLKEMALNRTANYSVQKLIDKCMNTDSFEAIYIELSDNFKEIVVSGCTGVLFSLCKTCRKLQVKESSFIKDIMKIFKCDDSIDGEKSNFVLQLLMLEQFPHPLSCLNESSSFAINLHGCLLVQEMLKFNKPGKVVKSILNMNSLLLVKILCDQKGSHIADAFFSNEMKKEKHRVKFINKLKGSFIELAVSKYGSFTLTGLWKVADTEQKLCIIKELASKQSLLMNSQSGKFIARAVSLETYRHQPKEWEHAQKHLISTRQLFSDVIR
ncbi:nucleolar protein 9 isoform X2 [Lycorma delicatula]|uniref:nucleolar protein 9 isoform X2 n=1 Tax=Lycorma delicatula TaxID=130591 RepID=UPI003F510102